MRELRSVSARFALLGALILVPGFATTPIEVDAQSLRGSRSSMDRQNRMARQHDFTFIETPERVRTFVDNGWLVRVNEGPYHSLHAVSFPYARPAVQLFIERLAGQYKRACGEELVVTSLTRPLNRQPRNASDRTVHPTGMALDIRYSWDRNCRQWLERVLLSLERQGVLEATLERNPRHYHIAIFPDYYENYVDILVSRGIGGPETREYRVRNGDSLWKIARTHGVSVEDIQAANDLRGSQIYPGQVIDVPAGS